MSAEKCGEWIAGDGRMSGHPCPRPVESGGKCKLHLGVARRRAEREAAEQTERNRDRVRYVTAQGYVAKLFEYGVEARPDWSSFRHGYTGGVTLTDSATAQLLAVLESER